MSPIEKEDEGTICTALMEKFGFMVLMSSYVFPNGTIFQNASFPDVKAVLKSLATREEYMEQHDYIKSLGYDIGDPMEGNYYKMVME